MKLRIEISGSESTIAPTAGLLFEISETATISKPEIPAFTMRYSILWLLRQIGADRVARIAIAARVLPCAVGGDVVGERRHVGVAAVPYDQVSEPRS
jgi:hypothetical protein